MTKRLIVVAGNIGAGKTSLTERIGARLGWQTSFESVADNPYLPDFYADMRVWSFHLQIFFLGHRAEQYLEMCALPQSVMLDRSIYEDAHIFARALAHIEMSYVEEIDQDQLIYGAIRGMVETLDPHTTFMDPEEYRILTSDTQGRFGGIGVEINVVDGWLTVVSVFEGGPAAAAGRRSWCSSRTTTRSTITCSPIPSMSSSGRSRRR